jgi:hypothetical protein
MKVSNYFFIVFFLVPVPDITAQPKPNAVADKVEILIGEQFRLKLSASFSTETFNASGFNIPDSIKHFEIIEKGALDSSITSGVKNLYQTITLTSFDSGIWALPPIGLHTKKPAGFSDSLIIKVGFDTTKIENINDIKPIEEAIVNTRWIYQAVGGITLLALICFIIFLYKTKFGKAAMADEEIIVSKTPPYEEAMEALKKLMEKTAATQEEAKLLHSDLTNVFKRYLLRANNINTLKFTTSETLIKLKDELITQQQLSSLAEALKLCDVVKFANYFPAKTETAAAVNQTEQIISLLHQSKQA